MQSDAPQLNLNRQQVLAFVVKFDHVLQE
jgi:hypothetical protein